MSFQDCVASTYFINEWTYIVVTGLVVQRIRDNFGWNRALCDKSTKFGTVVVNAKVTILKIGGTLKMP